MNIGTLNISTAASQVLATAQAPAVASADATDAPDSASGASAQISSGAKMMQKLADLASSDPAKFKAETAKIAAKLRDEAKTATGDQAAALNKLADKFDKASQTGDASALAPPPRPQGGGHGGGHHHHGGGGSAMKSAMDSAMSVLETDLGDSSSTATAAS